MTNSGQLHAETQHATYCHHTVCVPLALAATFVSSHKTRCPFSVGAVRAAILQSARLGFGHSGNANKDEQTCRVPLPVAARLLAEEPPLEGGLQLCPGCADPAEHIWELHVFTSEVQVLVISLVSAKGSKDFQIIQYWQVKAFILEKYETAQVLGFF